VHPLDEVEATVETRVTPGQPTHEGADLLAGRDKYNVILDINNTIIASLGLKELFNSIATALCDALPVDCTAIALYEEASDSLSVVAIEPFASSVNVQTGFEMPRHGTHSGWVLEHRQTLIATDLEKEQRFEIDRMLLEQGIRSYIVLPLVAGDGIIGTFHIGSPSPDRYSEEDIDFADLVAKQLALAIDNARQHEEVRRLKEQLDQVRKFPSERTIQAILEYSDSHNPILS
jgi:GAF domain-containing protein